MPSMKVDDIAEGRPDERGKTVEEIYARASGRFAIYLTRGEVIIQYADDQDKGEEQRKLLSPIRPLRGEIDGLLKKLLAALNRDQSQAGAAAANPVPGNNGVPGNVKVPQRVQSEASYFNRRVADALFTGLQGDIELCKTTLAAIRDEIIEELFSIGRKRIAIMMLVCSGCVLLALAVLVGFAALLQWGMVGGEFNKVPILRFVFCTYAWAAALFGAVGAWLSVAIGLRTREEKVSTTWRDNIVDPTLRVGVAVVSALILFSLVHTGAFSVKLGTIEIGWANPPTGAKEFFGVHVAIILGVIAGFTERLVGNFLGRSELTDRKSRPSPAAPTNPNTSETNPTGRGGGGGGGADAGGVSAAQVAAAAVAATVAATAAASEEAEDHSLDANPAEAGEEVPDEELPPASGGVAEEPK